MPDPGTFRGLTRRGQRERLRRLSSPAMIVISMVVALLVALAWIVL